MLKRLAYGLVVVGGIGLLTACAGEKKPLGIALKTNDLVVNSPVEAVSGKINVYNAMARAAKYNADVSAQNIMKKIYDEQNPKEIAEGILYSGVDADKLYNAAKAMDFADIYAMSVLTDNQKYIENALYAKSAQNLSIEAIRLHREEIFADKQISQIDRILKQQGKILKKLNDRMDKSGDLTESEIEYRKDLEVSLNNLDEIKKQLQLVGSEYKQLIATSEKNPELEGKRFYELDDFDKRYTVDVFQDTAMANRREFALAKEKLGGFNAAKARRQAFVDYPPVARLDINGLEIEDNRYEAELFNKAKRVTLNLLAAVEEYKAKPSKEVLKQKVFDELAALVMTQVELAYRLVEKASFEYDANRYKADEVGKTVKMLSKKRNLPNYEKIDLLKKQIEEIALEQKSIQILAERAAALRNLYYLAGLSPFDKNMLKGRVKDIEQTLKQAFNRDLIAMVSAVQENPKWDDGGNAWAHKDNWLEELIEAPANKSATVSKTAKQNKSIQQKAVVKEGKTAIQFGAYRDMDNAMSVKKLIQENVPALSGYEFFIDTAVVDGVTYHRLSVKPEVGKLQFLCDEAVASGFDCILK